MLKNIMNTKRYITYPYLNMRFNNVKLIDQKINLEDVGSNDMNKLFLSRDLSTVIGEKYLTYEGYLYNSIENDDLQTFRTLVSESVNLKCSKVFITGNQQVNYNVYDILLSKFSNDDEKFNEYHKIITSFHSLSDFDQKTIDLVSKKLVKDYDF